MAGQAARWSRHGWARTICAEMLAEFIGTAVLIAFGDGVVAMAVAALNQSGRGTQSFVASGDWLLIAWGWALAVAMAVYVAGNTVKRKGRSVMIESKPEATPLGTRRDEVGLMDEWDRSEWVGEGQEPPGEAPLPALQRPRWTKWQWIGEGQGPAGPRRGMPPELMPEGDHALSGHRHNPGMSHWGGTRFLPLA